MLPIWPYFPRRQALLFLIAILVPCAVLVVLGLQLMDQERQLEVKRLSEEQQRLRDQVEQELLSELEKITEQVTRRQLATDQRQTEKVIAFVGTLVDDRLQLPWENNPDVQRFRAWLNEGSFAETVREAERLESSGHQYERAARRYREAIVA